MSNYRSFNLDVSDTSDVTQIVDAMVEHARERLHTDLQNRIQELEEENENLREELRIKERYPGDS